MRSMFREKRITSLYIGGGTPTVLSERQLDTLFRMVRERIAPIFPEEVSVEMNPGTASPQKLRLLRTLGVTRISIGVQSFSNGLLERLGRTHTADEAAAAILNARAEGFDTVGLDLIYGIPGQTTDQWRRSVEAGLATGPEHLSLYCLSIEEGSGLATAVRAGHLSLPDDDTAAVMYEMARQRLLDAGYEQYELSNFALRSHACRHNLHYWERGDYIGFGPSAWSCIGHRRWMNISDVRSYIDRMHAGSSCRDHEETIAPVKMASERLFLGLRRTAGIDLTEFLGQHADVFRELLERNFEPLGREGLIEREEGRIRLTPRGMLVSNDVMERLIP